MIDENYIKVKKTTPYYNFFRRVGFPSAYGILLILILVDVCGSAASFWMRPRAIETIIKSLEFAILGLLIPSLISSFILRYILLINDKIFYFRRCLSLSLFSSFILVFSMVIGAIINILYPLFLFPDDAFYMGFFFMLPLRFIVIFSMTSSGPVNKFISTTIEPLITITISTWILPLPIYKSIMGFTISLTIGFLYCKWLLRYIDRIGFDEIETSPLKLFRSFLEVMLEGDNTSFEKQLEQLGTSGKLEVFTIGFRSISKKRLKGVFVVSNFHPGPFRNVGSSNLPYLIKNAVETRTGAITAVPHGISGHEMNLVSQRENEKLIDQVLHLLESGRYNRLASHFSRGSCDYATSSCQIFGDCPLITLTISPRDMEDIPLETATNIRSKIREKWKSIILIDSHNSISRVTVLDHDDLRRLEEAAMVSISNASSQTRMFKFAASTIDLGEFTPSQGVGLGGGTIFMFKIGRHIASYLVFDSNNLRKGLREELQSYLKGLDVDDSEILTTDTHMVNGLVASKLGYIPFGEAIPSNLLKERIKEALEDAKNRLEWAEASCNSAEFRGKILGLGLYKKLSELTYDVSKKVVISLFPIMIFSLIVFSTLFI